MDFQEPPVTITLMAVTPSYATYLRYIARLRETDPDKLARYIEAGRRRRAERAREVYQQKLADAGLPYKQTRRGRPRKGAAAE